MRTTIGKALIVLVFTALFLPCGCGEGGFSTPTGTDEALKTGKFIVPCSLVIKAEAEEILGETLKEPEPQDSTNTMGQQTCFFFPTSDTSFTYLQVSVVQTSAMPSRMVSSGMNAARIFQQTKDNMTGIKELEGVGDEAFWGTFGLHIMTGDVYIIISVGSSSDPANLEKAKKIALLILKRLYKGGGKYSRE
jgi:hypothetical protein